MNAGFSISPLWSQPEVWWRVHMTVDPPSAGLPNNPRMLCAWSPSLCAPNCSRTTRMLLYLQQERTHTEEKIQSSPSFRKLRGFDLKSLVHHYFMSQSHVGDSFSCLHQFLHRDKPGWAGYKEKMYIFVHNYTSFFQKIKFPSSGEHTGYKPIYWAHYLSLPNGFSVNVLQAGNTKCNKRWSPQFISQSLNKALCSAAHLPLSKASVVVAHGHEQKQKVTMFHSREVIICTNLNLGINTWEHFLHQNWQS